MKTYVLPSELIAGQGNRVLSDRTRRFSDLRAVDTAGLSRLETHWPEAPCLDYQQDITISIEQVRWAWNYRDGDSFSEV
jgi:hypothetical protein